MNLLHNASSIPASLMASATFAEDLSCRIFGRCLAGNPLDREVGNLVEENFTDDLLARPKLFTCVRYNPDLSNESLNALGLRDVQASQIQAFDSVESIPEMQQLGQAYANQTVSANHFIGFPL
jgi:hypothetical protein